MFERNVFDEYKLYSEERFMLGEFEGFTAGSKHYFFVCVDGIEEQEIKEMVKMGAHLQAHGDHEIATFIPTSTNALTSFIEGQNCVLFQFPQYVSKSKAKKSKGYELARLHKRGRTYPVEKKQRGSWPQFWINRLTQLELLYGNLSKKKQKSSFDQAFMISYPYYLGRTENAIQYIVDSDLDLSTFSAKEPLTICHYKFTEQTWLTIDNVTSAVVKNPLELVYDHPSRDLAEWIRARSIQDHSFENVKKFIDEYEKAENISPLSWRYIYGRLLFPIEYFEIIESHYRSLNDDEVEFYTGKLYDLMHQEQAVEAYLRAFPSQVVPRKWKQYVPTVDWLEKSNRF